MAITFLVNFAVACHTEGARVANRPLAVFSAGAGKKLLVRLPLSEEFPA
jgi:hypothetical protein